MCVCVCVCVFVARLVALYTLRGYVCVSVSDFTVLIQCLHLGQHFCRIISKLAVAKEFRKITTALFGEVRET